MTGHFIPFAGAAERIYRRIFSVFEVLLANSLAAVYSLFSQDFPPKRMDVKWMKLKKGCAKFQMFA
jgi:hypothetical protein